MPEELQQSNPSDHGLPPAAPSRSGDTPDSEVRDYRLWIFWGSILLLALVWRLLGITDTEVWRDEATTIIHTQDRWLDLLLRLPRVEDTPPLSFLIFKAWSTFSGQEVFLRLLPVLFGVAWVDVVMRTARLIEPRAWWAAGLLAAFSHVPVHFSQEIRVYSQLLLITSLCLWAAERMLRSQSPRRWLLLVAGLSVLAGHSHLAGVFIMPAVAIYLLVRGYPRWREFLRAGPIALWFAGVLPLIWFARYWSQYRATAIDGWWIPPLTFSRALYILESFTGIAAVSSWAALDPTDQAMWPAFALERMILVALITLIALGLASAKRRTAVVALLLSGTTFLACLWVSGLVTLPNVLDRTVLPAWTPVILALGVASASGEPKRLRPAGMAAVVLLAGIWAGGWVWQVYSGPPRRPVAKKCFDWLRGEVAPRDLIYSWPQWYRELTVYHLKDRISGEQVLDEFDSYAGRPPRHRMRLADPSNWEARFAEQLRQHRHNYGTDFDVWLVRWSGRVEAEPGGPEHFLLSRCREVRRKEMYVDRPLAIIRCRPINVPD